MTIIVTGDEGPIKLNWKSVITNDFFINNEIMIELTVDQALKGDEVSYNIH
jgi:hypothetical protein